MSAEAIASMLLQAAWCWVHVHPPSSVEKLPWWQVRSRRVGDEPTPELFSGLIMIAQPSGRNSSSDYHFVFPQMLGLHISHLPLNTYWFKLLCDYQMYIFLQNISKNHYLHFKAVLSQVFLQRQKALLTYFAN